MKLNIKQSAYNKMMLYAEAAKPNEIMGFAKCTMKDGELYVSKPWIPRQTVGSASTEAEPLDMVQLQNDRIFCNWHSHVKMKAFFSSVDNESMLRYAQSWSGKLTVCIILNLDGEIIAKAGIYKYNHLFTADCDVTIGESTVPQHIIDEVEAKLKKETPIIKINESQQISLLDRLSRNHPWTPWDDI